LTHYEKNNLVFPGFAFSVAFCIYCAAFVGDELALSPAITGKYQFGDLAFRVILGCWSGQ
jgi:hypothetical protein